MGSDIGHSGRLRLRCPLPSSWRGLAFLLCGLLAVCLVLPRWVWAAVAGAPLTAYYTVNRCDFAKSGGVCHKSWRASGVRATCLGKPDCASCVFCRWGREADSAPCPSVTQPLPAASAACPARAAAVPGQWGAEAARDCVAQLGLAPDPGQQLRGEVLDAICHQFRLAQGRNASRANLLIFSLGHDSPMWLRMNPHGLTRFVEDSRAWLDMQPPDVRAAAVLADYGHHWIEAYGIRCDPGRLGHFLRSPAALQLLPVCWDVVIIDAPDGWGAGRMGAIYAAAQLASENTVIFLDDCERMAEANFALWWLARGRSMRAIDNGHGGLTCMMYPSEVGA